MLGLFKFLVLVLGLLNILWELLNVNKYESGNCCLMYFRYY